MVCWRSFRSAVSLLDYLKRKDEGRYQTLIDKLGMRR